jgi:hypothetical protein
VEGCFFLSANFSPRFRRIPTKNSLSPTDFLAKTHKKQACKHKVAQVSFGLHYPQIITSACGNYIAIKKIKEAIKKKIAPIFSIGPSSRPIFSTKEFSQKTMA